MQPWPTRHITARAATCLLAGGLVTGLAGGPGVGAASGAPAVLDPTDQVAAAKLVSRSTNPALGPDLAGLVTDATTGETIWSHHPNEHQIPASNTKLVTAVNALTALGPTTRLTTRVVAGSTPDRVVLVGSGDPGLTTANLNGMARVVAGSLLARDVLDVTVYVDDMLFPAPRLAHGWPAAYVPRDVRAVRALVVDQHQVADTSIDAGEVFAKRLRKQGITVATKVRRTVAAPDAEVLASVQGRTVRSMVATMLTYSDNDYAEAFHRLVAIATGFAPTWRGARTAQRTLLATYGIDIGTSLLYDGSGLSRSDRITPDLVVRVLSLAFDGRHPDLVSLQHNSLAIAGRTGTLSTHYLRFSTRPTSCAAGLIEAKTGSLHGVIALSGFAWAADGHIKLFSFLLNRVPSTLTTRRAVDKLAATITGCW